MSWALAFVGFALLVVLHEFGHFAAAKAVGMRVERFALFFPPLIFKVRRGETEYGIGAIPLGGYVRITGMNPEEEIPPEVADRAYFRQPVWKRIFVIAAGPLMNILIGFVLLVIFFGLIGPRAGQPEISSVNRASPASTALMAGDKIIGVDGHGGSPKVVANAIGRHRCKGKLVAGCTAITPARIVVERDGVRRAFELRPRYDATSKVMRLGFALRAARDPLAAGAAISTATDRTWLISKEVVALPARLFDSERRKELGSVVGGYETTRQSIIADSGDAVGILAIISLSLALINLFPFLPLDGGHIFWALVEKVRRRPISLRVMERASVVGFVLVMMLFAVGLSNDIQRLQGTGFGQ